MDIEFPILNRRVMLCVSLTLLLNSHASTAFSQGKAAWRGQINAFLSQHCVACHEGQEPSGGLDLGSLAADLRDPESARRWALVHDRVASGEMPPQDEPRPAAAAQQKMLRLLADELTAAHRQSRDVVLRRLNRNEYQNTVRDLFGVDVDTIALLPQDNSTEGFDNIGEGLAMSAEATQAYLVAADAVLDAVFGSPQAPRRIRHETNLLDQKTHDGKPAMASQIGKMFRKTADGLIIFQSGYCPTNLVNFARLRAPAGTYQGTFKVRAVQSDKPVTLRIYAGDTIVGRREKHLVGYYDVPPGDWTTIKFTDKLVEPNGTFQPKCYGTRDTRKDADTYPEPGIEISDIVIEGPIEAWPPASRALLLGDVSLEAGDETDLRRTLTRFLPRAMRRPLAAGEAEPYVALGLQAMSAGRSFEESLRLSLKAVLCSPEFLFLDEPAADDADGKLSSFAIASRLSYFLWSSMPDEALFRAAKDGSLRQPSVLRAHTERMLRDPKASAFTENFVGQWLELRDINFTTPDQMLYPDFDELLQISMVEETHRFFNDVLANDGSVLQFVDSDFTYLNQRLAEHYGIPGVVGQAFRRVPIPRDNPRGGVLTMASVLKVTANGTTTSPVIRGAWVLEKIQGVTIPPPPSNVPAVEPDIRGAVTLRDQLAKHRNDVSCAVCHNKIDPAGFALENFDVIGGWRDRYRTLGDGQRPKHSQDPHTFAWIRWRIGLPVDSTGQSSSGIPFTDIREFKKILLDDEAAIINSLTRQLTTYALGRRLGFSDREDIAQLVTSIGEHGSGLRSLVHAVVQSRLFHQP